MYNKIYDFPLVVVKDSVPTQFQIDDSRTGTVSPMSERRAKQKQHLDDIKVFEDNDVKTKKIMAMCEDVFQQSKKDKEPPKNIMIGIRFVLILVH